MSEGIDIGRGEREVLSILSKESDAVFAFQGLKRKLDIHQEKLSRILKRLEDRWIIKKVDEGYALCCEGYKISLSYRADQNAKSQTVLQAYLPIDVDAEELSSRLKGRWFGNLRWLGRSREPETILRWLSEDGKVEIAAKFRDRHLSIETNSKDEKAIGLSYDLFYSIVREIR